MSEAPKFDFSRIRVGNAMGKFKPNEIALPKNNASDTVKADKPASEKTETPDTAKNDQIASQKTETPDKAKNDQIASQKTETPDAAKNDQIASQKTETPETAKTDQIASQKTQFSSGKQKNITESTKEIQELLAPLKANYSISSAYEKQVFVNKFKEEIRKNSRLQELLISGGTELIKIICEPLDIPIDMGEKWLITAQHYQ
jgi:hypothetical protein